MSEYTSYITEKSADIWFEDEDYKERLLDIVRSFRTFDATLDVFLMEKGYSEDISNTQSKIRYIQEQFQNAGIAIDIRILRNWFEKHIQPKKREIAFQFCFAFHLSLEETEQFFRKVYMQRNIDCHSIPEAIYYYCLSHRLSYANAQELIERAPKQDGKGRLNVNTEVLYTGTIIRELDRFQTTEELLEFLSENAEQFSYNNATAKRYVQTIWNKIAGDNGVAYRELCRQCQDNALPFKYRSTWDIYLQMFGFLDVEEADHSKLYPLQGDRTLQTILKKNDMIHPIVCRSFPDRHGLEEIIKGNWQSDEVIRKTLIMLSFYRFWADLLLKSNTHDYVACPEDYNRYIFSTNRILTDASYPELYEGNPYDWIFLYASQDADPLYAFRCFMREVYCNKCDPQ